MSNFFLADRVKETSRVQGTSSISLDGAAAGFSAFKDFYASGDVVFYAITDNVNYEIGSGVFKYDGSTRVITRNPFRSSNINAGPWYVNATSNSGPTNGQAGYFYPLWLSRSAAQSGIGFTSGPFTSVSGFTFNEYPGITFYYTTQRVASGVTALANSGANYATSGQPVSFGVGVKEVFATYPGKTAVYNGAGVASGAREPKESGVAFWKNEQIINYTSNLVWNDASNFLGVNKTNPSYVVDVGGSLSTAIVRASGFIDGGSGILFSGGQLTDTLLTASGGRQYEPFRRNRKGNSANGIIELSGVVDQIIGFANQPVATVMAGPVSGACDPCPDGAPTFRRLVASDLPDVASLQTFLSFVTQKNLGLDNQTANISPNNFIPGMVAVYHSSGNITYDSGIFYDMTNNRLVVGGNAATDAATYTLDLKGASTLSAASGYVNHLIFTDDLVRIGDSNNNTNRGNLSRNFYIVSIGKSATLNASGMFEGVLVGRSAGSNSAVASGVVGIGTDALKGAYQIDNIIAVGQGAGMSASGGTALVMIGKNTGFSSSGLNNVIAIGNGAFFDADVLTNALAAGNSAASGAKDVSSSVLIGTNVAISSSGLSSVVGIGEGVVAESSGATNVIAFGDGTLRYTRNFNDVVAIGKAAARSGVNFRNSVAIGGDAAKSGSGTYNIYLGTNAGASVSGHENIEIIASGTSASFLTHQASGKINIGNTIVGDIYNSRLAVGKPSDVSPSATLYVRPKVSTDPAFIIQHQNAGSATVPYMQFQSGNAVTFYSVTNSGDVITSGYLNPSGGILLEPITPANWMNSTANRLYNDGGTLKFNGSTITVGGSYSFYLTDGKQANDQITDAQVVTVSGVSGVEVQYNPAGGGFFRISASGLSGVLQSQITAQTYKFYSAASGYGSNNNAPKEQLANSYLVVSGVSGVKIDHRNLTDGTNSSGIYIIGYDPTTTYSFNVTNGDVANDAIANTQTITVSGVSGLRVEYDAANNFFRIGASGLSGVLNTTINNSGNFLRGQILQNTASGLAISGIAAYASGQIAGFTALGAISGIKIENNRYSTDSGNRGYFSALLLNSSGSIVIGTNSAYLATSGYYRDDIIIGNFAGRGDPNPGSTNSGIAIGNFAGSHFGAYNISIGSYSNFSIDTSSLNTAVGHATNMYKTGGNGGVCSFGALAGSGAWYPEYSVNIGYQAGAQVTGCSNAICIGRSAGFISTNNVSAVLIGNYASTNSFNNSYSINIGDNAGSYSVGNGWQISLGLYAGALASGSAHFTSIGTYAGYNNVDSDHSTFIGYYAGYKASGVKNSISLRSDGNTTNDFLWLDPTDKTYALDIGKAIQGYTKTAGATLHIGRPLDDWGAGGGLTITALDIKSAALNLTPANLSHRALMLWLHPQPGFIASDQSENLFETQYRPTGVTSAPYAESNPIINQNGVLRLPLATSSTGTGASAELTDTNGRTIPKGQGVFALYELSSTNKGLAVCLSVNHNGAAPFQWYKLNTTTTF